MRRHLFRGIVAAGLVGMAAASAAPQDRALIQADRDRDTWRLHGRTYDNQRFSPLTQITATSPS